MIAAHRRAHRRIHAVLWPLVAALGLAAWSARRPVDAPTDWPGFLAENAGSIRAAAPSSNAPRAPLWTRDGAFGSWPVRLALFEDGRLELRPHRPLEQPELLLYWLPGAFSGDRLPDHARLLGRLAGPQTQRFLLPPDAMRAEDGDPGSLVVYGLGHAEIVASARLSAPVSATAAASSTTRAMP